MRPARSSTATCFCTAAKLISYRAARSDTDGVSVSDRARMSRRVPSAKARNSWLIASSLSFLRTTIWLYVYHRSVAFARRIRWTAVPLPHVAHRLGDVVHHLPTRRETEDSHTEGTERTEVMFFSYFRRHPTRTNCVRSATRNAFRTGFRRG